MAKTTISASLAWRVEETCLNAWPALREIVLEGWLVRFAEGISRRLNSANPLSTKAAISDAVIAETEAFYRRHGLPAIFRVPSLCPPAVERALDERGYTAEGETCVLHGALDGLDATTDPVRDAGCARADKKWFPGDGGAAGLRSPTRRTPIAASLARSRSRPCSPRLARRGRAARRDRLRHRSMTGCSATSSVVHRHPPAPPRPCPQDRHHPRRLLAQAQGATGACSVQVVAENSPARALYDQIGLKTELYRYHYRRAPAG